MHILKTLEISSLGNKAFAVSFKQNFIDECFLSELESFCSHLGQSLNEIEIVIFKIESLSLDPNDENFLTFTTRLKKLTLVFLYLPQLLIADFGLHAHNEAIELALSFDLRLSHHQATFTLDYLSQKRIPCIMSTRLFKQILPFALINKWPYLQHTLTAHELLALHFLAQTYTDSNFCYQNLLKQLTALPLPFRAQNKKLTNEILIKEMMMDWKTEMEIITGSVLLRQNQEKSL